MLLNRKNTVDKNIKDTDISVVVQGAIDEINTPICLNSIRKQLPNCEIILSTWDGSNVERLNYDKVIFNKDPGNFDMSPHEKNNVERQIISTVSGLKQSSRLYVLKIRSDISLDHKGFIKYFNKFCNYDDEWHFLNRRIIIPNMVTRDPRYWESPMCPSDWCSFGLREDMLSLWDNNFLTEKDKYWFENKPKPELVKKFYSHLIARYNPEQIIWIGFISKFKKIHADHMFDINNKSIEETLKSYANNLIILSEKQFGIKFLKKMRIGADRWRVMTYIDFLKIYNSFSNGRKYYFPINFQRYSLLKNFKESHKRLYPKFRKFDQRYMYWSTELTLMFPLLSKLAIPLLKKWNK